MGDPLDIVNEFMSHPVSENPWPYDSYWFKKVCALAERIAKAENEIERLKAEVQWQKTKVKNIRIARM